MGEVVHRGSDYSVIPLADLRNALASIQTPEDAGQVRSAAERLKEAYKLVGRTVAECNEIGSIYLHATWRFGDLVDVPVNREGHIDTTLPGSKGQREYARKFRKALGETAIDEYVSEATGAGEQVSIAGCLGWAGAPTRANQLTGEIEWYTPPVYIEAARNVMGGIDLDPASSDFAQEKVQADRYYTIEDNGLELPWEGRVWLNPPYKAVLVKAFIEKLLESPIDQAILLTNNATDTGWWHEAAGAAAAICFHRGRIQFYRDGEEGKAPTHGQTFMYFGTERDKFIDEFITFGMIR